MTPSARRRAQMLAVAYRAFEAAEWWWDRRADLFLRLLRDRDAYRKGWATLGKKLRHY